MRRILNSQILRVHSSPSSVLLLYIKGILTAGSSFLGALLHAPSIRPHRLALSQFRGMLWESGNVCTAPHHLIDA